MQCLDMGFKDQMGSNANPIAATVLFKGKLLVIVGTPFVGITGWQLETKKAFLLTHLLLTISLYNYQWDCTQNLCLRTD